MSFQAIFVGETTLLLPSATNVVSPKKNVVSNVVSPKKSSQMSSQMSSRQKMSSQMSSQCEQCRLKCRLSVSNVVSTCDQKTNVVSKCDLKVLKSHSKFLLLLSATKKQHCEQCRLQMRPRNNIVSNVVSKCDQETTSE